MLKYTLYHFDSSRARVSLNWGVAQPAMLSAIGFRQGGLSKLRTTNRTYMSRRLSWRWDHCPTPYLTITSAVSANGSKLIVQWVIVRNRAGLTSGNLLHWKDRTKNRSHMLCLGQMQWSKAKFKSYQAKQWNLTLNVELINANQEK